MSTRFPDRETIDAVLSLATWAPSVHNTQPWRWQVGSDSLHLFADLDRDLPSTDPDSRDLLLSCGASLHHCVVALAALGWRSKVHRLPNPGQRDHLASVEVSRHPADELDVTLAAAIPQRRTYRRHYSPQHVPISHIALMGARAARAGVMLRHVESSELQPVLETPVIDSARDNAVVLALGTKSDSPLARLRAGEATSLVLLTATSLGMASCPVTEPLEIAETRDAMQVDVFGSSGFPQMLLRIGWAPLDAEPLPATPGRPLADVVEWHGWTHCMWG